MVLSGLRKINTTSYLREPPGHTKSKAAQVSEGTVAVTVNDPTRTCLQRGGWGGHLTALETLQTMVTAGPATDLQLCRAWSLPLPPGAQPAQDLSTCPLSAHFPLMLGKGLPICVLVFQQELAQESGISCSLASAPSPEVPALKRFSRESEHCIWEASLPSEAQPSLTAGARTHTPGALMRAYLQGCLHSTGTAPSAQGSCYPTTC